jgi:hypothetical protein
MTNFPVSILCSRRNGSTEDFLHSAVLVSAVDRDQAAGIGLRIAEKIRPGKEGWKHHINVGQDHPITPEGAHLEVG